MSLIIVLGLLALIAFRGLGHFWPAAVVEMEYVVAPESIQTVVGEVRERETVDQARIRDTGQYVATEAPELDRLLVKIGNRRLNGLDFRWVLEPNIVARDEPPELMVLERREWGNFYGRLTAVKEAGDVVAEGAGASEVLLERLDRAVDLHARAKKIEKDDIGSVNYRLEQLRLKQRRLELDDALTAKAEEELAAERARALADYEHMREELSRLNVAAARDSLVARVGDGREVEIPLASVVRAYWPNAMSLPRKVGFYLTKAWEFVSDEPREANTEGGIFPAIFGTVMMVMVMAVLVAPFGVVAAVYLREYANQGVLTRTIRIAVNNLAGVPSIVYGVFGLGFFVYFLGGSIDRLFFPEALPAPTFGTPGILWSSLTLAVLTLPVVIVSTEEGLTRIPRAIREGSLALGATKAETLRRVILPMASPAIMTGLILAVARAAGEVAPLMLVGVVKLAPSLPLDGNAPFVHLDRKFMHLGFHIYDVGFQSPNVEAARPLVYATALLLVLVIIFLNLAAIRIRNYLREKYRALEN
ncbi:MAG: phosphate ABC transporter permease PstA [Pseudomonadota bacterium]|nr:phosphate ABC transporter permease PstA [Pseudomonadota bacterium]